MARKNSGFQGIPSFFTPPGPHDPIGNILAAVGNTLASHGLKKLSREAARFLGLSEVSINAQIALNRSQLQLAKQEADNMRAKMLSERQLRILDLKIEEKEIEIERRKQLLEETLAQKKPLAIPVITEVVSGALEVTADPEGLTGFPDQLEGYTLWLDSFGDGKVIAILGKRGSGKTALAAKIGEYMMATHKMPTYWIGLPENARGLLPNWVTLVDSPDKCPVGCFIIIDEAGIQFLSLAFNTDHNRLLRALLMVCRQRHCSLVFAVQSSRDMDYSILRQADTIIFKEPGLHQPDSERLGIKPLAKKAALVFQDIPKDERREAAYVFDDDFEGIIKSTVPSFWSEDLSHVYAHFDLAGMKQQAEKNKQIQRVVVEESKLLEMDSEDREIMELRRKGYGIEAIAKTLGCTTYRVRKCLNGMETEQS